MNEIHGHLSGAGKRFAIVVSRFNNLITEQLLSGARDCLLRHGVDDDSIQVFWVPGAWELPAVAGRVAGSGKHDRKPLGDVLFQVARRDRGAKWLYGDQAIGIPRPNRAKVCL